MRIGIAIDYGKYANASSLNLIAKKVFLEMGKMMNEQRTFTISAIKYEDIGIGDVNQHFDCISIPNMGGYRFPHAQALTSNNLCVGIVGIDEVVLREKVYKSTKDWELNKPIIEKEVERWKENVDKIRIIHVSTESDKKQLMKYLNVPEEKLQIIPLGVDHEIFTPTSDKGKTRRKILGRFFMLDNPYFLHVSESNWARKNIFRLLEAFSKARDEGIEQNLIIVGKADDVVYKKAQKIKGVFVMGYVSEEDLILFMQGADALIVPSLHEGFGLPLVEAMACGTPIITSNVFSPPEVVGEAGLFVDPYNVSDITDKIVEMSENNYLRETLSKKAIERADEFSWKQTSRILLQSIQNTKNSTDFDFDKSFEISAYRTLTTVCEIIPELRTIAVQDLLEFDYSRIIRWAVEVGLENPLVGDFLIPFRDWLVNYSI